MRIIAILFLSFLLGNLHAQKVFQDPNQAKPIQKVTTLGWFKDNPGKQLDNASVPRNLKSYSLSKNATGNSTEFLPGVRHIVRDPNSGLPIFIEGKFSPAPLVSTRSNQQENLAYSFLQEKKNLFKISDPETTFHLIQSETDDLGVTHLRMEQHFSGIPVYGAEIRVHLKDDQVELFNGRYYPSPELRATTPSLSEDQAKELALQDLRQITTIQDISPALANLGFQRTDFNGLFIFFKDPSGKDARLAYQVEAFASIQHHWSYLIDAQSGEILQKHNLICKMDHGLHREKSPAKTSGAIKDLTKKVKFSTKANLFDGPATANATDLNGSSKSVNTYEIQGTYFLLDASRSMWKGFTPDGMDFTGGIYTADGKNTNTSNFEAADITSATNSWGSRSAVSGHVNAGIAYEYFRSTFSRNSINGSGGNIISFINVADDDGGGLDNAFWSGQAMFYGNGRDAFSPLAGSLDVAGHEMSHGVIQNTANLEYQGESGALNESFADIFGVMIDRDDWRLGEEVVNTQIFRSGALRDMQNPNNGGSRLGDPGYQPASVSEQFFGSEDNGGVHINSGIVNRAFYLFATANGVGRDRAEQVYYRALDRYLTRSSQFIDARLAVIRSAEELYGASIAAAAENAFSTVGIGNGAPTAPPQEADLNEGSQFIMVVGEGGQGIYLTDTEGNVLEGAGPLVSDAILFKPSISDNGSRIAYINGDNQLRLVRIDWQNDAFDVIELSNESIWRRVAISKDGNKLAATTTDLLADIQVFDLRLGSGVIFDLFNPTTAQGVSSGEVQYADGLEWDLSSQFVIYDAFNEVKGLFSDYSYADIGSIEVWDNDTDTYSTGDIEKLFASLPDGVSVGNPAISKNSPNILVFDYLDDEGNFAVFGTDIETSANDVIAITEDLGFPNYSVNDDFVIHQDQDFFGDKLVKTVFLNENKISPKAEGKDFLTGAQWPNWFATGSRVITSTPQQLNPDGISMRTFPNPGTQNIFVETELKTSGQVQYQIFDLLGQLVYTHQVQASPGVHQSILPIDQLAKGTYILKMKFENNIRSQKIVKW